MSAQKIMAALSRASALELNEYVILLYTSLVPYYTEQRIDTWNMEEVKGDPEHVVLVLRWFDPEGNEYSAEFKEKNLDAAVIKGSTFIAYPMDALGDEQPMTIRVKHLANLSIEFPTTINQQKKGVTL